VGGAALALPKGPVVEEVVQATNAAAAISDVADLNKDFLIIGFLLFLSAIPASSRHIAAEKRNQAFSDGRSPHVSLG
jgi:hypothetical protein